MVNYIISEELRNDLLSYLYNRPYKEVSVGVRSLESLKEEEEKQEKNK